MPRVRPFGGSPRTRGVCATVWCMASTRSVRPTVASFARRWKPRRSDRRICGGFAIRRMSRVRRRRDQYPALRCTPLLRPQKIPAQGRDFVCRSGPCGAANALRRYRHDARDLLLVLALGHELDLAGHEREQRVILADADIDAGMDDRSALADDDAAGVDRLLAVGLDAEALGFRIAAVPRAAARLFMCHGVLSVRRGCCRSWVRCSSGDAPGVSGNACAGAS